MDRSFASEIQARIDNKTKPLGALGLLEKVALELALIQSQDKFQSVETIEIRKPTMLVFVGDHGIAKEGVGIAPSAVTQQMVANFLTGGAAINCFCDLNQIDFKVIDCGMLSPIDTLVPDFKNHPNLIEKRLGNGTANFGRRQCRAALPAHGRVLNHSPRTWARWFAAGAHGGSSDGITRCAPPS